MADGATMSGFASDGSWKSNRNPLSTVVNIADRVNRLLTIH